MNPFTLRAISFGVNCLLDAIKNPGKRAKLKTICLSVYRGIKDYYADDPDFQ